MMGRMIREEWVAVLIFAFIIAIYINTMGWFFIIGETGLAYFSGLLAAVSGTATVFFARKKGII